MKSLWWLWIPAILHAALASVLCFVPLFDLLGYEYALATGLLAVPTGLFIGLSVAARFPRLLPATGAALGAATAHLLPSVLVISANAFRVRNCDFLDGLGFFFVLPLPSATYAAFLGLAIGRIGGALPRWHKAAAALVVAVAPLIWTLATLYLEPAIFAYDHLWGYFAGSLYDEAVQLGNAVLAFRGGTLLRIVTVPVLLWLWESRGRFGYAVLVAGASAAIASLGAYELVVGRQSGFRPSRRTIEAQLSVTAERPGIIVHMPEGTPRELQESIADEHLFRLQQIKNRLGVDQVPVVHSYVYPDARSKARLMGGSNTMIAKPWLFEIHIHGLRSPHPVLAHELAHVVAGAFGAPPLNVSARYGIFVNMGLVEGLAEAVTPERHDFSLDNLAKAMRDMGRAPPLEELMRADGFWTSAPRRAYTVAGSFVRYLLEEYGPEALREAYSRGDIEGAYGESLPELIRGWHHHLDEIEITETERRAAEAMFNRSSIFSRPCAHEIARLREQAREASPERAILIHRRICGHLGDDPMAEVDLALALERAERLDELKLVATPLLSDERVPSATRAVLFEAIGNLAWKQDELDAARDAFQKAGALTVSLSAQRLQWARLWALEQKKPLRERLRSFFSGELAPLAAVVALTRADAVDGPDPTLRYLVARQLHRVGDFEQAYDLLSDAGPHPFELIELERRRLMADTLWQLGRLREAEQAYLRVAGSTPLSGIRMHALDRVERIRWDLKRSSSSALGR